ncbi:hypothetical protein LAZ67_10000754 [Cordylochernes scorpioides]|uniref:Transposase n=1 Tax=Cordylochernes scorpioides TaxID=51811 RepID=A0ABY6KXE9_9ARAC|nr:hypothetical protein LAZ67_10000754 [Cordylochernes scorpioides]
MTVWNWYKRFKSGNYSLAGQIRTGRLTTLKAENLRASERHELTTAQPQQLLDLCRQLLEDPRDDRFWKRIVTMDNKWVYLVNRVLYFDLVPNGRSVEADLYCEQLERVCTKLTVKYLSPIRCERVLLQTNNPRRQGKGGRSLQHLMALKYYHTLHTALKPPRQDYGFFFPWNMHFGDVDTR